MIKSITINDELEWLKEDISQEFYNSLVNLKVVVNYEQDEDGDYDYEIEKFIINGNEYIIPSNYDNVWNFFAEIFCEEYGNYSVYALLDDVEYVLNDLIKDNCK